MKKQANQLISKAFVATLPVLAGYVVLGTGFGILLRAKGYGLGWALAMSVFIYAGSMQYLTVDLLAGGASLITAGLTTLMVNARHLFYGISMIDQYKKTGRCKPYLIFSLTDETYSQLRPASRRGGGWAPVLFPRVAVQPVLLGRGFRPGIPARNRSAVQHRGH